MKEFLLMTTTVSTTESQSSPVSIILMMLLCFAACCFVFRQKKKSKLRLEIFTEKFKTHPTVIEIADDVVKRVEEIIITNKANGRNFEIELFVNDREIIVDGNMKKRYLIDADSIGGSRLKEEKEAFIRAIIVMIKKGLMHFEKAGLSIEIVNETGKTVKYVLRFSVTKI